jgi:hypothetical protein
VKHVKFAFAGHLKLKPEFPYIAFLFNNKEHAKIPSMKMDGFNGIIPAPSYIIMANVLYKKEEFT